MMKIGLKALSGDDSAVLILGTFPGEESLAERQYYAHPRNLFWNMMDEICGAGHHHDYEQRCELLKVNRIAVWDVLKACDREGSSDGQIKNGIPNDFNAFFLNHPFHTIFFNGKKAFKLFTRHVNAEQFQIHSLIVLPSTSPANARITCEEKLARWRKVAECIRSR